MISTSIGTIKMRTDGDSVGCDETPSGNSISRVNPFSQDPTVRKESEVEHLARDLQVIGLNSGIGQTPPKQAQDEQSSPSARPDAKALANEIAEPNEAKGNEAAEQSAEPNESALERLARNLEAIGKYRALDNDVKEFEMVAFKVFAPTFQMSNYVIGMVEAINRKTADDFDLTMLIMGKAF